MPHINILPIDTNQVTDNKKVNSALHSGQRDEFENHLAQQNKHKESEYRYNNATGSTNNERSNSAVSNGNDHRYSSEKRQNNQDEAHQVSSAKENMTGQQIEQSDQFNGRSNTNNAQVAEAGLKTTSEIASSEQVADSTTELEKVTADKLLTMLGASEKTLMGTANGDNSTTKNTTSTNAGQQVEATIVLKGPDIRIKSLISGVDKPNNAIDLGLKDALAELRGQQGKATQTENGVRQEKLTQTENGAQQEKAAQSENTKQSNVVGQHKDDAGTVEKVIENSKHGIQASKTKSANTDDSVHDKAQNPDAKLTKVAVPDNSALERKPQQQVQGQASQKLVQDGEKVRTTLSTSSVITADELQAVQAQTTKVNSETKHVEPFAISQDVDNNLDNEHNKSTIDGKDVDQKQNNELLKRDGIVQANQVKQQMLVDENNVDDNVAPVVQAPLDKVGQSNNNANNHSRFINQSTQDAVQVKANLDQPSQENSDQKSQRESTEQESEINLKNTNNTDATDKKQSDVFRGAERNTVTQPISTNPISNHDAATLDRVMDKLSGEVTQIQQMRPQQTVNAEALAVNRKDFVDNVKDKVMVMINRKIQQLEIRLDPAELGAMQVKLNMQNEQAAISIVVQNPQAKEALEQNIQKLRDMLQESGVDVGDANIEHQQANEQHEMAHQENDRHENELAQEDIDDKAQISEQLFKASSTGVDYYA